MLPKQTSDRLPNFCLVASNNFNCNRLAEIIPFLPFTAKKVFHNLAIHNLPPNTILIIYKWQFKIIHLLFLTNLRLNYKFKNLDSIEF